MAIFMKREKLQSTFVYASVRKKHAHSCSLFAYLFNFLGNTVGAYPRTAQYIKTFHCRHPRNTYNFNHWAYVGITTHEHLCTELLICKGSVSDCIILTCILYPLYYLYMYTLSTVLFLHVYYSVQQFKKNVGYLQCRNYKR